MKEALRFLVVAVMVTVGLVALHVFMPSWAKTPRDDAKTVKPAPAVQPAPAVTPVTKPAVERSQPLVLEVIDSKTGKQITFGELMDRLNKTDIVCVGEKHDSELCHRIQLQVIKGLFAQDERLGVGMEMFQKPFQAAIDRYFAGDIDEDQFLKDSEYAARWGYDWKLYRPIVEFCRKNDIPLAALNVRKELTKRLYKVGYDGLTDEEKKQLGPIDFQLKAHRDYWYPLLTELHGIPNATDKQKEASYSIMAVWDDYMAHSTADFKKERQLQRMVVLAGSGHINGGFGIPDRAGKYAGASVSTVAIEVVGESGEEGEKPLPTDFVIRVSK